MKLSLGNMAGQVRNRVERAEVLECVPAAGMCIHELYEPGNRARKMAGPCTWGCRVGLLYFIRVPREKEMIIVKVGGEYRKYDAHQESDLKNLSVSSTGYQRYESKKSRL